MIYLYKMTLLKVLCKNLDGKTTHLGNHQGGLINSAKRLIRKPVAGKGNMEPELYNTHPNAHNCRGSSCAT